MLTLFAPMAAVSNTPGSVAPLQLPAVVHKPPLAGPVHVTVLPAITVEPTVPVTVPAVVPPITPLFPLTLVVPVKMPVA